jgi:hypothetical protein
MRELIFGLRISHTLPLPLPLGGHFGRVDLGQSMTGQKRFKIKK